MALPFLAMLPSMITAVSSMQDKASRNLQDPYGENINKYQNDPRFSRPEDEDKELLKKNNKIGSLFSGDNSALFSLFKNN